MILSKVSYVMTLTVVRSITKICKETSPSMINVLKKGLKTLEKHVASCKTQLEVNLKAGNIISADDKAQCENAAANNGNNNIDDNALIA